MSYSILHNIYDPDSTFDILWADRMHFTVKDLLFRALGNHLPIVEGAWETPIILIERFTPDKSPWAWQWSTKFYEFIRKLSRTWLIDNGEIIGTAYGFDSPHHINWPNNLMIDQGMPPQIFVKIAPGATVTLNWLQKNHLKPTNRLNLFTDRRCVVYEKVCRKVTNPKEEEIIVEYDTTDWLINSLVIGGNGELTALTDAQRQWCLYEFFDVNLDLIYGQLQIPEIKVLVGMTVTLSSWADISNIYQISYTDSISQALTGDPLSFRGDSFSFSNPIYQELPDNYHYSGMIGAKNNYWAAPYIPISDLSELNLIKSDNFIWMDLISNALWEKGKKHDFFLDWRNSIAENNPYGYDIINQSAPIVTWEIRTATGITNAENIYLFATTNNNHPGQIWDHISSNPGNIDDIRLMKFSYPALFASESPAPRLSEIIASGFRKNGNIFLAKFGINQPSNETAIHGDLRVITTGGKNARLAIINYQSRDKFYTNLTYSSLNFGGDADYRLFSEGQCLIMKNSMNIFVANNLYKLIHESKINKVFVDYSDLNAFSVSNSNSVFEENTILTSVRGEGGTNWINYLETERYYFSQSDSIRRRLRTNAPSDCYGEYYPDPISGKQRIRVTEEADIKDKVIELHQWQEGFSNLQPVFLRIDEEFVNDPIELEHGYLYYVQTEGLNFVLPSSFSVGQFIGIQLQEGIQRVTLNDYPEEITGWIDGIPAYDAVHLLYYDGENLRYEIGDY